MSTYGDTPIHSVGPGRTVDTGDQLGSVVLLAIAVVGAAAAMLFNALIV